MSVSVRRQCELLGLNRSGVYYRPQRDKAEDAELMRLLDEQYTRTPFYSYRRMTVWFQQSGMTVNGKRVRRLMKELGLEAIYPKPNLSKPNKHKGKAMEMTRPWKTKRQFSTAAWKSQKTAFPHPHSFGC